MNSTVPKKGFIFCLILSLILLFSNNLSAQMRQLYVDNVANNQIYKLSFYSPSQGFVAFRDWVGYTTDSGRSFTKKYITLGNVNYNGYSVNLTFGFGIAGVKAFDQNNIIVYGDYGFVPSILYSNNGGSSYTLVFHSQYNPLQLSGGILDMAFPQNNNIGFATDADRILKSTNQGLSWSVIRTEPGSNYAYLEAVDNNNVFAVSPGYSNNKLIKTSNGGTNWQTVTLPAISNGKINNAHFLTANTGWLNMYDDNNNRYLYKTTDGGNSWTLQNNLEATPFICSKMRFVDANTGFALSGQNTVYKTFNSGVVWEPLPRDNNYTYLGYTHNDLQCLNATQLWAGGGHGFLEINTNAGGQPIPKAYFRIDTTGLSVTNTVNLLNYSRTGYTYKWFLNNTQISTAYNASYTHNVSQLHDTIKLVVSNGTTTDTLIKYQDFFLPVVITSFSPTIGATGTAVTITGINLDGATSVKFGGVWASNFTVVSNTQVNAIVGAGATGNVTVTNWQGTGSLGTFTYYAPPTINLTTTISDNILCKAESITVAIQNTEANVKYELIDSLNNSYGSVNSNGGNVAFYTSLILRSGNYKIKATRLNVSSSSVFTDKILILVEHTKSVFRANRVNVIPAEKINFTNHSVEAQNFTWTFNQDANIGNTNAPNPQNIFYGTPGQKTLSLISISLNGCRDTLLSDAALVYSKPFPDQTCYVQNVSDSDFSYYPESPASANKVLLADDNGYYVSGFGNNPQLKSIVGVSKTIASASSGYFAKYTTDGALSWYMSVPKYGKFNDAQKDNAGNIYIVGQSLAANYLTFPNGDSIKISARPADTISYINTLNGFIVKLDSNGNYLWHTIISGTSAGAVWVPGGYQGSTPERIKIVNDQIAVSGSFLQTLEYWKNGTKQDLVNSGAVASSLNNFILRINPDGTLAWHMYFEHSAVNLKRDVSGIGIDNSNNYYITGFYENQVKIHDVGNVNNITYTGITGDARSFLLKFDSNGKLLWKVNFINTFAFGDMSLRNIATSGDGESYITGSSSILNSSQYFQITNSNGSFSNVSLSSYFLLKFDANGMYKWGAGSKYSYYGSGNSVLLKGANIYTTGMVSDNGQPASQFKMTSSDNSELNLQFYSNEFFIAKYDTSGILRRVTKSGNNGGWLGPLIPNNLIVDQANNFIVSGSGETWGQNNNSFPCFGNTLTTWGSDAFFTKLNPSYCYNFLPPVANAGPDKISCSGDTVTIGTAAINGNSYSWVSSPAGFTSTLANPVVSPVTTTTYYLSVISSEGLIARDTVVITTAPSPTANAGADQNICAGTSVTLGTPAVPGITYSWTSNPAGFTSAVADPVVTPSVTTQYFLTVANAGGCAKKDTVIINVGSSLAPAVTITASTINACAGTNVTFTATAVNGGSTPAYQWKVNGSNAGTNSNTFNTNNLVNGSIVTVVLTTSLSCASQTTATSNSITINVSSITPSVSISASSNNICPGTNVIFTAISTNGGTTPVYQWKKNGINTGTNSNSYSSNTLLNGDIISVSLTSNAPCATPAVVSSNNINMTVNALSPATISINGVTTVTQGTSTLISSVAGNAGSSPAYQWQDSTNTHTWQNINGATSSSINYSPALTGNKLRCILTANNPCITNNTATSNALTFTVTQGFAGPTFYPNPVSNYLVVDGLSSRNSWETVHILTMSGAKLITIPDLTGLTRVVVNVESLPPGIYMCVLNSRFGYAEYYKFVKL